MIIKRIDEASFHRRPWGVLEDYLADRTLGPGRRAFIERLRSNELLALVSKNGMNVIFVRGFDEIKYVDERGTHRALIYLAIQLDRPWTLEMLQVYVRSSKIPFKIDNYAAFEDIFPAAARAAKAIVRKGGGK